MRPILWSACTGLLLGCSVSVDSSPTTCPFDGSYSMTATRQDGTCPDGLPADTWTVARVEGTTRYRLTIPARPQGARLQDLSFDGNACTATWRITEPVDTTCGATPQTESYTATFDSTGVHGTMNLGSACNSAGTTCDGVYAFAGTRN